MRFVPLGVDLSERIYLAGGIIVHRDSREIVLVGIIRCDSALQSSQVVT